MTASEKLQLVIDKISTKHYVPKNGKTVANFYRNGMTDPETSLYIIAELLDDYEEDPLTPKELELKKISEDVLKEYKDNLISI